MRFTVTENRALTKDVSRMTLAGDTRALARPGQFVQVQVPGFYLRRPLSVYDWQAAENGWLVLVYKALGHGTQALAQVPAGAALDVLTGLGNGFMTDAARALAGSFDYVYACGPEPMLKAVYALCGERGVSGQFSFEERMGCGFGACMGCTCKTKTGGKRICKEGPVLVWEEILW